MTSASASRARDWDIVCRAPAITSTSSACTRSLSLHMTSAALLGSQAGNGDPAIAVLLCLKAGAQAVSQPPAPGTEPLPVMETNLAEPDMFRYRFRPHSRRNPQTAARQYRAPSPSHT